MSALDRLPGDEYKDTETVDGATIGHASGVAVGEHDGGLRVLVMVHRPHSGPCLSVGDLAVALEDHDIVELIDVWARVRGSVDA